MTLSERRVLLTHLVGEAWEKYMGAQYLEGRKTAWTKSGCAAGCPESNPKIVGVPHIDFIAPGTSYSAYIIIL